MSGTPEAGWYTDPEHEGQQRYWDGAAWSDQRRAIESPTDTPLWAPPAKKSRFIQPLTPAQLSARSDPAAVVPPTVPPTTAAPLVDNCLDPYTTPCPFQVRMQDELRKVTRDKKATLIVRDDASGDSYFGINIWFVENLTKGLSEKSTRLAAVDALRWAQHAAGDRPVEVVVRADLTTKLGQTIAGAAIVTAGYPQSVLKQIVFSNFDPDNVFSQDVANIVKVLPAGCGLSDYC